MGDRLDGKTPWEFACEWYQPDEIARVIEARGRSSPFENARIPTDIYSREFAEWMTEQYRLAMTKGIQIGLQSITAEGAK